MSDLSEKSEAKSRPESGDVFAHLRHELRTPLNQIIGYSEMLQEDAEAAGQQAFIPDLQKIHKAAQILLGAINTHLAKPVAELTADEALEETSTSAQQSEQGQAAPLAVLSPLRREFPEKSPIEPLNP